MEYAIRNIGQETVHESQWINELQPNVRKAYGYRTTNVASIALYHSLGELPMPKHIHKF